MRPLRTSLAAIACVALAALLSGCGPQNCGCGASPDDALAQHDLTFPGEHELADGCACRCGDGSLQPRTYDDEGTCEYEGETCTDDEGYPAELVCSG
jgi:hypothetical protein